MSPGSEVTVQDPCSLVGSDWLMLCFPSAVGGWTDTSATRLPRAPEKLEPPYPMGRAPVPRGSMNVQNMAGCPVQGHTSVTSPACENLGSPPARSLGRTVLPTIRSLPTDWSFLSVLYPQQIQCPEP
jgi:hypothetical protein